MNPTLKAATVGSLALAGNLITMSTASAACGSFGWPGCISCTHIMAAANYTYAGCVECFGFCYQFASPREQAVFERVVDRNDNIRRASEINILELSRSELNAIAQVNPTVALVLAEFMPGVTPYGINIKKGRIAYKGMPTESTLQLKLQNSVDGAAYAATMSPLSSKGTFVLSRWTSAQSESGDLVVTFHTDSMNENAVLERQLLPPMRVIVQGSPPYRILKWEQLGD
jgi:hypothetical protein